MPIIDRFRHESLQDPEAIVDYLRTLADGFEKGHVVFVTNQQRLVFEPHGLVKLDVKAKRRHDKTRITLKFTWREEPTEGNNGES